MAMINKPCIIILETHLFSLTYDSRDSGAPFKLEGKVEHMDVLRGMALQMDRELRIHGVSLVNKNQLDLLKWRERKKK